MSTATPKRTLEDVLSTPPPDPKRKRTREKGEDTITDQQLIETDYMYENKLRKVRPYWFHFTSFVKGRWIGRTLYEVFANEFRLYTPEYFKHAIGDGRISIDGKKVLPETKLKNNQWVTHLVHRHEPPVTDQPVQVVLENDEIIVINKPSSIPMHPTGGYRHNTVLYILAKENKLQDLYPINRLDRLTSGVVVIARNAPKAEEFSAKIRDRSVKKFYLARTIGVFPEEEVTVDQAIQVTSHIYGINEVNSDGKSAVTIFRRLSTTGKTSVVLCQPLTGRTHQIRVHLQHLGHPIINDPLYARPERLARMKAEKSNRLQSGPGNPGNGESSAAGSIQDEAEELEFPLLEKDTTEISRRESDPTNRPEWWEAKCSSCLTPWKDPTQEDLVMYLHARKYEGEGWVYEVPDPEWAAEDFDDTACLERLERLRNRDRENYPLYATRESSSPAEKN
eukprot:TRINITY_DN3102_c0_g1_i7.p1 TRINITY_DN3102_c0_g1~~TRINITY_DN3102_c0_g1_i7.p1  ORF type:complete len:450 (-),score=92.40 TRINITY_DN3102_c0_g1_i7:137-1486(-)